jgi:hypothetical protein
MSLPEPIKESLHMGGCQVLDILIPSHLEFRILRTEADVTRIGQRQVAHFIVYGFSPVKFPPNCCFIQLVTRGIIVGRGACGLMPLQYMLVVGFLE